MKDNVFLKILEKKKLPHKGICGTLYILNAERKEEYIFDLFRPSNYEEIDKGNSILYWASGVNYLHPSCIHEITPLRQTILMLCNEIYQEQYKTKKK